MSDRGRGVVMHYRASWGKMWASKSLESRGFVEWVNSPPCFSGAESFPLVKASGLTIPQIPWPGD